jgi:hypothetical protein
MARVVQLALPAHSATVFLRGWFGATMPRDHAGRGAATGDERRPINQRACDITVSDSLIPFHERAQDEGTYVLAERAREADRARPKEPPERPSDNSD